MCKDLCRMRTSFFGLPSLRGVGSGSRDVDAWSANGLYAEDRGFQVPMVLENGSVTSRDKSASGRDPRISHRIQIGMFRPIRVDHTNCLPVTIKTHSFIRISSFTSYQYFLLLLNHRHLLLQLLMLFLNLLFLHLLHHHTLY